MLSILQLGNRWHVLLATLLVLLTVLAGAGSAYYVQSAQGHHPDSEGDVGSIPKACQKSGFSFASADSIEDMLKRSDLVVVGRAGDLITDVDTFDVPGIDKSFQDEWAIHDIEVIKTLMGDVQPGESIRFGTPIGHCLEEGTIYVLFLERSLTYGKEYVDSNLLENPTPYGLAGAFGPQAVWRIEGQDVVPDRHEDSPIGKKYSRISKETFLGEIKAAVDKMKSQ